MDCRGLSVGCRGAQRNRRHGGIGNRRLAIDAAAVSRRNTECRSHLALLHRSPYIARMSSARVPADIARRAAQRIAARKRHTDAFRRDTFTLPREAARAKARELLSRYPKAAYMTEIE